MTEASPTSYLERYLDPFRDLLRRDDVVEIAINPDGKVIYRADWSFAHNVDKVLSNRGEINTNEHVAIIGAAPWITIPVTLKGGWLALYDILIIFPKVYYEHIKLDIKTWMAKRKNKTAAAAE